MNLKQKTVKNTMIVFAVTFFNRGVNFLTKIILARLLFPEDFGLVAIASIIINSVGLFRELGIESALIYRKTRIREAADTAFILLPVTGLALYSIIYFAAPYVAGFYGNSIIKEIVRISGITLVLVSINSVPLTLFSKKLDFKRSSVPEVTSSLGYAISTIYLAYQGFNVWSLVYGGLIGSIIGLLSVWLITDYKPRLYFEWRLAKEMIGYGKYVLGASIVIFFLANLDNAVVGKILGMKALGYYAMAFSIGSLPATNVTHIVGKILFPTYSAIQDDKKMLCAMFTRTVKYISFLTIPLSIGLIIFAEELVYFLLGAKWTPTIPLIRILSLYGLLRSFNATTGGLFKACGDPKYLQDISVIQLVYIIVFIVPAAKFFGIYGVSLLILGKGVIATCLAFPKAVKYANTNIGSLFQILKNPLFASMAATGFVFCGKFVLGEGNIITFALISVTYTIVYCAIMLSKEKTSLIEIKGLILETILSERISRARSS